MRNRSHWNNISWFWIVVSYILFWPVGVVLTLMKVFGENSVGNNRQTPNAYQPPPRQDATQPTGQDWNWSGGQSQTADRQAGFSFGEAPKTRKGAAYEAAARVEQRRAARSYQAGAQTIPPPPRKTGQGYRAQMGYISPGKAQAQARKLERKIAPNRGRGLVITGWLIIACGVLAAAITMLASLDYNGLFRAAYYSSIVALCTCGPGMCFLLPGTRMRSRSDRCQTFYVMLQSRHNTDIRELAAAVHCSYSQAVRDLRWMINEGFFPGAYIDVSKGMLIYAGSEPQPAPVPREEPAPKKEAEAPKAPGVFPEVVRIRQLNSEIGDAFVTERMGKLEELTQKILSYVEQNPEKEDRIRQFRQHYLPKTIKILESYARFEKQGVAGANIRAAMKDVEEIMDTLVTGFEKQLDMLFVDEALDVTTDINVLESMMGLQGLSSDDPFKLELMGGDFS